MLLFFSTNFVKNNSKTDAVKVSDDGSELRATSVSGQYTARFDFNPHADGGVIGPLDGTSLRIFVRMVGSSFAGTGTLKTGDSGKEVSVKAFSKTSSGYTEYNLRKKGGSPNYNEFTIGTQTETTCN